MLHVDHAEVQNLLLTGNFGLERESLRIDRWGFLAQTDHPFSDNDHIVRDFCENQTEINTPVVKTPKEAVESLIYYDRIIQQTLRQLPEREYLWPFSNPPYIRRESDVRIASFSGSMADKTRYREYLSDRYGRYKMTFSGIHFNYSFSDELLRADFELSEETDFQEYKTKLYLMLAEKAVMYGWLLIAITAASPILDSSFLEKNNIGGAKCIGMGSIRCSELGYWNAFAPILDYSSVDTYADSIQKYVDDGFISAPSELYYPVRLKPRGENRLSILKEKGIDHIELRMFDLNPFAEGGIDERDVRFTQLFLTWLASTKEEIFGKKDQVQAVQNFKNAAHFDLKTVKILLPNGEVCSVAKAALRVLDAMEEFYQGYPQQVQAVLAFEKEKFINQETRYAWKVRKEFMPSFVEKGIELARKNQEKA